MSNNGAVIDQPTGVAMSLDPMFGVEVPLTCAGVPDAVLNPRATWSDKAAYDAQAARLARMFQENFKAFASDVLPAVVAAGPQSR